MRQTTDEWLDELEIQPPAGASFWGSEEAKLWWQEVEDLKQDIKARIAAERSEAAQYGEQLWSATYGWLHSNHKDLVDDWEAEIAALTTQTTKEQEDKPA